MSRICEGRDELLLKFAHGQLGLWQRIQVRWHVRRCPACSGRLEKFSVLSTALAVAMASGSGPRWLPSYAGLKWGVPRGVMLGGIVAILTLGVWSLRNSAQASVQAESKQPVAAPEAGACSPTSLTTSEQVTLSPVPSDRVSSIEEQCAPVERVAQPSAPK